MNYWFLWRNSSFSKKIGSAFLLLALSLVSVSAYAAPEQLTEIKTSQQRGTTISGTVVDVYGDVLIGVNVEEEGTYNGTSTDVDGKFSLTLTNATSNVVFSYLGYDDVTVKPTLNAMKIVLTESTTTLDEVVVVGYGAQKKESVVGSIAQVQAEELKSKGTVSNITDALSGSMPGVTVMTASGTPGGGSDYGAESVILVRGMTTWNESSPLILVDGVERDMNDVDINEIESFSVLKDASATAVFGVKGANGVILINTKRGEVGEATVSFEANVAVKTISDLTSVEDSYDGLVARNYSVVAGLPISGSDYWSYYTSNRVLEYYRTGVDPEKYTDVDWRDEMLRDQAVSQKYNASISGGTEFVKYFTSIGYLYEGDIFETRLSDGYDAAFGYNRFNFRTNLDFKLTKTTEFSVNLSGYYGKQQAPDFGTAASQIYYGLYKYDPSGYLPIYSDGTWGSDYDPSDRIGTNSLFELNTSGNTVTNRTSVTTDFELKQDLSMITEGLSIKGKYSYDNFFKTTGVEVSDSDSNYIRKGWDETNQVWIWEYPSTTTNGFDFSPTELGYTAESANASSTTRDIYYEIALNYARQFGDHNVGALALFSREHNTSGSGWPEKREDWVGRLTYDYKGKYLFETNGAYNGSELFGPDYRFDFFPSVAVGWRASEEAFVQDNLPFISNLKFKYSIGLIGNDNLTSAVGQWAYVTTWEDQDSSDNPYFGSGTPNISTYPITTEGTPGNEDLQWEVSQKQNLGMEFGFFDGLISGNLDLFDENRTNMLLGASSRTSIPDFFGQTAPAANVGEVYSKGMEFDVKVQKRIKEVNLWASYNWSVAKNEIIYKEDLELSPFYQQAAGYSIGQVKTTIISGILNSWDEIYTTAKSETSSTNSALYPGKYQAVDYNGNGIIDSNDSAPYGYSTYPQNTYGFALGASYKGFSVSATFYGAYNTTINCSEFCDEFSYYSALVYTETLDSTWTPEYNNSDADYRALRALGVETGATGTTTYYDGSYLRLKSAEISYTLPKTLVSKLSMQKIRVYVNGNNLCFWSDLPIDIEGNNFSLSTYPVTRQINFGANIVF